MDKTERSALQQKAYGTYDRNKEIKRLYEQGLNYAQIGRIYRLSRQAVRVIVLSEDDKS